MEVRVLDPILEIAWIDKNLGEVCGCPILRSVDKCIEDSLVPLDVFREGDDIVVRSSIPGAKAEDINVTIEDGLLSIEGNSEIKKERDFLMQERKTGLFHRTLRLPDSVDFEKAESSYEDGVLTIKFPQLEAKKPKRLVIIAA